LSSGSRGESEEIVYDILADGMWAGSIGLREDSGTATVVSLRIEPQFRRGRIASHVLRWLAHAAAARGAHTICADAHSIDRSAIPEFRHAGFVDEKPVHGRAPLTRHVKPLQSVQPQSPGFAALPGRNVAAQHIALGEAAAMALRTVEGVQLVLGLGSIGRGFGDANSDVDLFVIGRGSSLRAIPSGERWLGGHDFDVFVFDLDEAPYAQWTDDRRQAISEGAVLWAANSQAVLELRRAIRPRTSELKARAAEALLSLSWIGFHPPSLAGRKELGYYWILPHDLWLQRGHVPSAHGSIDEAVGFLFALIFLANRQFLASHKWRRYLVEWLAWTPPDLGARIEKIERASRDEQAFAARAQDVLTLIEETFERLKELRLLPRDVYRSFRRSTPDYSSHNARRLRNGYADPRA
jgi:hypothetical protein